MTPGAPPETLEPVPPPFELFNLERLAAHARALAEGHRVTHLAGPDKLLPRLGDNERRLREACEALGAAKGANQRSSYAAEWLLDNVHVIEEQVAIARRHLPRHHSRELPHLVAEPFYGYPRVYHLAIEVIAHVDGRVDRENISRFVEAYQEVVPLSLGELWAIPIMLRLALLENLRRVAVRVQGAMEHRLLAEHWADRLLRASEEDPRALLLASAEMARSNPQLTNAFVAEFVQRVRERNGLVDIPLTWIDHQLAVAGASIDSRVRQETWQQAVDQVSVAASIGSLRFLGTMPWPDFVEELSAMEQVLRRDPCGVYPTMDFATRDRYRHVVEDLARGARVPETAVAERAVAFAAAARAVAEGASAGGLEQEPREGHVGHYLLDRGLGQLLDALPTLGRWQRLRAARSTTLAGFLYFGVVAGVTVGLGAVLAVAALVPWHLGVLGTAAVAMLAALCASQLGVSAANALAIGASTPRVLPRLDLRRGIPAAGRTLVVVPTLVSSRVQAETILEGLEVRFLGNRDTNLYFGLLTDFVDAPKETEDSDEEVVSALTLGIAQLNDRYRSADGTDRFVLFHRPRTWNPREGVWMGYERKRGKLEALNHLLRGRDRSPGDPQPALTCLVGDLTLLRTCKYVITLDTDTQLPQDAAQKLIGTMAHPLNHPRHDPRTGCVVEGYGVLQPRVDITLPATRRSWFSRLTRGDFQHRPKRHEPRPGGDHPDRTGAVGEDEPAERATELHALALAEATEVLGSLAPCEQAHHQHESVLLEGVGVD